jgi:hypothetical protein
MFHHLLLNTLLLVAFGFIAYYFLVPHFVACCFPSPHFVTCYFPIPHFITCCLLFHCWLFQCLLCVALTLVVVASLPLFLGTNCPPPLPLATTLLFVFYHFVACFVA